MGIREDQKKETKEKIYHAIMDLVREKDYESITIREICTRAGISIGTYYKYYNSKDDIVFQQVRQSSHHTVSDIVPSLNRKSGIENLKVYLKMQYDLLGDLDVAWLREVFRLYLYRRINPVLDREGINYKTILQVVRQGQQDGTIVKIRKAEELAWIILKMIIANFYCFCMQDGDFDLWETMSSEILAICQSGKGVSNE